MNIHGVARISRFPVLLAIACLISMSCSGCNGSGDGSDLEYPSVTPKLPDTSQAGEIRGTATFQGVAPERRKLPTQDAYCGSQRAALDQPHLSESVIVNDGKVENVFVYISKGLEAYTFDHDRSQVEIDQRLCVFIPHVLGVRRYQPVAFKTSDRTPHNVNTRTAKRGGNKIVYSMAPGSDPKIGQFKDAEIGIPVRCDMHSQMTMYIHVMDHPYFAVTGADGTFTLPDVPPGTYTLTAWHEQMGTRTAQVTVGAGGKAVNDFSFKLD